MRPGKYHNKLLAALLAASIAFAQPGMTYAAYAEPSQDEVSDDAAGTVSEGTAPADTAAAQSAMEDTGEDDSVLQDEEEETTDIRNAGGEASVTQNNIDSTAGQGDTDEDEEDGVMVVGGYIEMPWDDDTPVAEEGLEYIQAIENIVDDREPARNKYVTAPVDIQGRFPDYDTEDKILDYLTDTYPATRSQSPYGSCWAHSAIALSEFYLISHGLSDKEGTVDRLVDYSELQLAYFCYNQAPNPVMGDTGDTVDFVSGSADSFLNFGGNTDFAAQSLMRYNGVTTDTDDAAYSNASSVIANGLSDEYASDRNVVHLKNEYQINIKENPDIVKEAILENGIVGASFYANDSYWNQSTNAYYNNVNSETNHAVAIVGWDDDYPVENFNSDRRPDTPGAWLVRNSWTTNTRFSYFSYFWMSYCDTSLSETAYVFEMTTPEEMYDNNYYYDSELHDVMTAPGYKVANVYTVRGPAKAAAESLKAVQIDATMYSNVGYTIQIYRDLTDASDPTSGTEVTEAETTGTLPFAGKYTIPLNTAVELNKDEVFSVVVTTTGGRLDRERDFSWQSQVIMDTNINAGESFYYTGGSWSDLSSSSGDGKYGNLCIRALTDDIGSASLPENIKSLSLRNKTESTVTLGWAEAADAEGYEIWYSEEQNGSYVRAGVTAANERRYTHSDLESGTTYYYKVYPIRNGVIYEEGVSPILTVTTMAGIPEVEVTDIGYYTATARWNALTNCDGYEITYGKVNGGYFSPTALDADTTEYRLWQLEPGAEFYVKVRSYTTDSDGNKVYGEYCEKRFTTENGEGQPVSGLKVEPYDTAYVRLSWEEADEAWGYKVEKSTDGENFDTVYNLLGSNSVYIGSLDSQTRYYFRVSAVYYRFPNECIEVPAEVVSSYTKLPATASISVALNGTEDAVNISWSAITGASYYSICRKGSGDNTYLPIDIVSADEELTYTDTSVSPGRIYYYRIAGCRTRELTDTQGAASMGRGIRVPLSKITDLSYSDVASDGATLTWSEVNGAEGYAVKYYDYSNKVWQESGRVYRGTNTYVMTGLTANTYYCVSVEPYTDEVTGSSNYVYFTTADLDPPTAGLFDFSAENAVYDGNTHAATVVSDDDEINNAGITLAYAPVTNGTAGTYTSGIPKDAGIYQVRIATKRTSRYSAATITDESWRYTISPREIKVSGITAANKTYDGNTNATLVTSGAAFEGKTDSDVLTVAATGAFSDENAGSDKAVVISSLVLGGSSVKNYTLASSGQQTSATADILPKSLRIKAAAKSKVYGAQDPALTYTVTTGDLVTGDTAGDIISGMPARDAGEDTGVYTIRQGTLSAGENYSVSFTGASFTITTKSVTSPDIVLGSDSYVYSGSGLTPEVVVKDGDRVIPAGEYTVSYSGNINVGEATIRITDKQGGNYVVSGSRKFTIIKADASVLAAPAARTLSYNMASQELVTAGSAGGGVMQYRLGTNGSYGTTIPRAAEAGSYTVFYKVQGDSNHNDTEESSVVVTVDKASTPDKATSDQYRFGVSRKVDLSAFIIDEGNLKSTVTGIFDPYGILDGTPSVAGDMLSYAFVSNSSKTGRSATVTLTVDGGNNYYDYDIRVTLTVLDIYPQIVEFTGIEDGRLEKIYGSASFSVSAAVTQGDGVINSYSSSDTDVADVDETGKVYIKKAGTTTITAVSEETEDYARGEASYVLEVKPKDVELVWGQQTFTYDGDTHVPAVDVKGIVGSDTCNAEVTGAQKNAGTYTAVAEGLDNENYRLPDNVTTDYTIIAKEVSLKWTDTSLTYNGNPQQPAASAEGLAGDDVCSVTVCTEGAHTKAGTYTAMAQSLSNTNYTMPADRSMSYKILPRTVTISVSCNSRPYEAGNVYVDVKPVEGSESGIVDGDDVRADTSAARGEMTSADAGDNKAVSVTGVTLTGVDADSYVLGDIPDTTVNITKAEYDGETDVHVSKKYIYDTETHDSFDISTYLPADSGNVKYSLLSPDGDISYTVSPEIEDGELSYTVSAGDRDITGRIRVKAVLQNYEDITITVDIRQIALALYERIGRNPPEIRTARQLTVGKSFTLVPMFAKGHTVLNQRVVWSSSNPDVATVTQDGKVTAMAAGYTEITVRSEEDSSLEVECAVSVTEPVSGITLNKKSYTMGTGESVLLEAKVLPYAAIQKLEWKSNNDRVIIDVREDTLSAVVSGVSAGSATVTVQATDGSGKKATCTFSIGNPVPDFEVTSRGNADKLKAGTTLAMSVYWGKIKPKNAGVVWKVYKDGGEDASGVATITDKGVLKGLSEGMVTVEARSVANPDKYDTKDIMVYVPVKSAALNASTGVISQADDANGLKLSVSITPTVAGLEATGVVPGTAPTVKWSVDEKYKDCLTVSEDGLVAAGQVTGKNIPVRAEVTAYNGYSKILTCKVTVNAANPLKTMKLSKTALTVGMGNTAQLTAILNPVNPDGDTGIIWESSDKAVAIVDDDGNITGITPGTATVTATTKGTVTDKKGVASPLKSACKVTVRPSVAGVVFTNAEKLEDNGLATGKTYSLKTRLSLSAEGKASNTALYWISSDPSVATVTGAGLVRAVNPGEVTIKAVSTDVKAADYVPAEAATVKFNTYALATKVAADKTKLTLGTQQGTEYGRIRVDTLLPANVTDPRIQWKANNENVELAAIAYTGRPENVEYGGTAITDSVKELAVRALHPGVTKITGTTMDGSNKKVTCTITVRGQITGLALKEKAAVKGYNDVTYADDTETGEVEYTSSMKPNSSMTVKTVTDVNGISGAATNAADKKLYNQYKKYTDTSVSYASSDTSIATVTKTGKITTRKNVSGTVKIYVESADGNHKAVLSIDVR